MLCDVTSKFHTIHYFSRIVRSLLFGTVFLAYQEAGFGDIANWRPFSQFQMSRAVRERLEERYRRAGILFRDDTLVITPEALRHGKLVPAP